jgi:hypothetical protein
MRKKRPIVQIEQLEPRVTPDVAFGRAASALLHPAPNQAEALSSRSFAPAASPLIADLPGTHEQANTRPAEDVSYLQALGSIFSNSTELDQIFHPASKSLTGDSPAPSDDAAMAAWRFLANYSKKAIYNDESRFGSLPDHEDLVHQIYADWLEQVKNDNGRPADVLNRDSGERLTLRKTVRRVLDHARYETTKQRRMVELIDQPARVNRAEADWVDMQIDAACGTLQLDPRERRLLELRREGKTFEEIGSEIGLVKQRVYEMYNSALGALQELYAVT